MSSNDGFRIQDFYGNDVKLVINGKRGFTGKLFPNGNRASQAKSSGAGGNGSSNGAPEKGRRITKKSAGKIQRTPTHMRFDNVRGNELIVINTKGNERRFDASDITSHKWNDMHNGTYRLCIEIGETQ